MIVLGIDPGLGGGLALLEDIERSVVLLDLADMPIVERGKGRDVDGRELATLCREWKPGLVVLEAVHAMPKQGVSSTFSFGRGVGIVVGVLSSLGIPFLEVGPQTWQKSVLKGIPGEGKRRVLSWAWSIFPDAALKTGRGRIIDGRADALALAWYGITRGGNAA